MIGKVKWFNNEKGYGFITYDGKEIFVHYSQIEKQGYKTLNQGDLVSFKLIETPKGLQAQPSKVCKNNSCKCIIYIEKNAICDILQVGG